MSDPALQNFQIPSSSSSVLLETTICLPWDTQQPSSDDQKPFRVPKGHEPKLAIVAHPFGRLGGSKDDPVITRYLRPTLIGAGFVVVTYNARGVGQSQGWASWLGGNEGEDAAAVVSWVLQRMAVGKQDKCRVVCAGYSYGSLAAVLSLPLLTASYENVQLGTILISPPISIISAMSYLPSAARRFEMAMKDATLNGLVIYGDRDQFTARKRYSDWVNTLNGDTFTSRELRGDHFWRSGSGTEMAEMVREWLSHL